MKSIRYSWAALLLLLSLFSCQQAHQEDALPRINGVEDGRVYFTMKTALRATHNTDQDTKLAAKANEKQINDIAVVVFDKDHTKVVKVIPPAAVAYTNEANKTEGGYFELDLGAEYKVHFIANAPKEFIDKVTENMPESTFNKLVVETTPPEHGNSNFIMYSKDPKPVNLSGSNVTASLGNVMLTRLAARIDVYNTVHGFEMTEITLAKRQEKSFIVADGGNLTPSDADQTYTVTEAASTWFTPSEAIAGLYTYEQSETQSNAFKVVVKGNYNNEPVELEIPLKEAGGANIVLKRNFLYRIVINSQGVPPGHHITEGFRFNIEVLDWNDTTPAFVHDDDALDIVKEYITGKGTPLSYVAKNDVKDLTGSEDVENNENYKTYLQNLKWEPVNTAYAAGMEISFGGAPKKMYYLPTKEEWLAVIPGDATNIFKDSEGELKMPLGPAPIVKFGNKTYTMKGNLYALPPAPATAKKEVYGAFVYTPTEVGNVTLYVIAAYTWGYYNFDTSLPNGNWRNGLMIKMAVVNKPTFDKLKGAEDETVGLGAGIKTKFSTLPEDAYETRLFRAIGYWNGSAMTQMGVGYYWTASSVAPNYAWNACCFNGSAYVGINSREYGFRVRLFARD